LLEPASRIERAILEHAGLVESKKSIDAQLLSALESMSDDEKRQLIFKIINKNLEVSSK
ncbi:integrase, partial [Escherichia coli]|nr:integrase [Escherichia coli]